MLPGCNLPTKSWGTTVKPRDAPDKWRSTAPNGFLTGYVLFKYSRYDRGDALLAAFFLHLFGFLSQGRVYILLNIIGAGLSCYASVLIRYWPFVVLEGCWVLVSILGLAEKEVPCRVNERKVCIFGHCP